MLTIEEMKTKIMAASKEQIDELFDLVDTLPIYAQIVFVAHLWCNPHLCVPLAYSDRYKATANRLRPYLDENNRAETMRHIKKQYPDYKE